VNASVARDDPLVGESPGGEVPGDEIRIDPDQWPELIAAVDGPQLVVGGPGTGKTEFIVRRATYLIDSETVGPEHLLVLTFSRRGTRDLDTRIRDRLGRSVRSIDVSTYHSFAMRLLEAHAEQLGWESTPQILAGAEQRRFVGSLLATESPQRWSPAYRGLLTSRTFADEVTEFLLRCREQLLDPEGLRSRAASRADWSGLPDFLERYDAELRAEQRIDYGTLLSDAVRLLANEHVRAQTDAQYRYVLVDEYQDTTAAQAGLLEELVGSHRNLTAAADPYQSIYSFRGTDLANVYRFPYDFRDASGRPGKRIVLTTSFRVPEAILTAAVRVTAHDLPGAAGKVLPTDGEGSVETYRFEQQVEEAEWIASEIHRLHLEQRIPYARMAVFVRSKRRFLTPLSRALEFRGIPHDRPDSRLDEQPAVQFTIDCVIAATNAQGNAETDRAVRRILLGSLFRLPLGSLRDLERTRLQEGKTWSQIIGEHVPEGKALASLLADPDWATAIPASVGLWDIWSKLPQMREIATAADRSDERAAWSSFAQVLERWNEREPLATLNDYRRNSAEEEFEASPLLGFRGADEDRLTLATLHQSKGLEFDVVFIADAVEGVLPDLRTRDSLLGIRYLNDRLPADEAGYIQFRLQEERRLAYTAMTRATRRVVWTTTDSGFDEGGGVPSRFLALVAGTETVDAALRSVERRKRPITPRETEAALRRTLTDPSAAPPDRLAAAMVLADGEDHGMRAPTEFYGALDPGPDDGFIEPPLFLSPSQAELYEACPRRYALERKLGVGDGSNIYAQFGGLVHDVLEAAERRALERGADHASVREALEELDDRFEPDRFGGGAFAEAWRERARTALSGLYENWPSTGSIVALEHPLEIESEGARWFGRADRIERSGETVTVVDYKTSKAAMAITDAETSFQLGFYLLAAQADPDISTAGTPDHAELWYPLAFKKSGITVREFDPAALSDIEDRMRAVAAGVAAEQWPATPGPACTYCAVASVCPARPEGKEAFSA
jgi:superfamily I DNA/RNA helicase/CRISPR/Cas system-associated exonuclease Cas4 (RecB family)